jgi:hypothetical protein
MMASEPLKLKLYDATQSAPPPAAGVFYVDHFQFLSDESSRTTPVTREEINYFIQQLYYRAGQGLQVMLPAIGSTIGKGIAKDDTNKFAFEGNFSSSADLYTYLQDQLSKFNQFVTAYNTDPKETESLLEPYKKAFTAGQANKSPSQFLLMSGGVDKDKLDAFCKDKGVKAENAVFVFSGNTSHHGTGVSLYSKKSGAGLAEAAGMLSDAGRPVLSLPTTGIASVTDQASIPDIAKQAVADLWKAVGFGLNIVLPVVEKGKRPKKDADGKVIADEFVEADRYFPAGCQFAGTTPYEPRFWGGVEGTSNPELARYYFVQLLELQKFMNLNAGDKLAYINDVETKVEYVAYKPLIHAYKDGQAAKVDPSKDPWFQKPKTPGPGAAIQGTGKPLDAAKITDLTTFFETKKYTVVNNGGLLTVYKDIAKTESVYTVSGDQITATKPENDQTIYENMIEAALLAFPGKTPLHVDNLSVDEKVKFDAALTKLTSHSKIPTGITFDFGAPAAAVAPVPPPAPSMKDNFKEKLITKILNAGKHAVTNDNDPTYTVTTKTDGSIDITLTLGKGAQTQNEFKSEMHTLKMEFSNFNVFKDETKIEFNNPSDYTISSDDKTFTLTSAGMQKLEKLGQGYSLSLYQGINRVEALRLLDYAKDKIALIKEFIDGKHGEIFKVNKITDGKVEIVVNPAYSVSPLNKQLLDKFKAAVAPDVAFDASPKGKGIELTEEAFKALQLKCGSTYAIR